MIYHANIKKGKTWKNQGNHWQINSALITKIHFSNNRFASCYKPEKLIRLFFIVEKIDFNL